MIKLDGRMHNNTEEDDNSYHRRNAMKLDSVMHNNTGKSDSA